MPGSRRAAKDLRASEGPGLSSRTEVSGFVSWQVADQGDLKGSSQAKARRIGLGMSRMTQRGGGLNFL